MIKAKIRSKLTKTGTHFSVSVVRVYRNGDQWKESTRYGRDDIPIIRLVLDEAFGWIYLQQEAEACDLGRQLAQ